MFSPYGDEIGTSHDYGMNSWWLIRMQLLYGIVDDSLQPGDNAFTKCTDVWMSPQPAYGVEALQHAPSVLRCCGTYKLSQEIESGTVHLYGASQMAPASYLAVARHVSKSYFLFQRFSNYVYEMS